MKNKKPLVKGMPMTIENLAIELQAQINDKMEAFTLLGKQAKELRKQIDTTQAKLDKAHLEMGRLCLELEPVEAIIIAQNPDKAELFELLKNVAKENDGK